MTQNNVSKKEEPIKSETMKLIILYTGWHDLYGIRGEYGYVKAEHPNCDSRVEESTLEDLDEKILPELLETVGRNLTYFSKEQERELGEFLERKNFPILPKNILPRYGFVPLLGGGKMFTFKLKANKYMYFPKKGMIKCQYSILEKFLTRFFMGRESETMSKIINLTPHPIKLLNEDGNVIFIWNKPSQKTKLPRLIEEVEKRKPLQMETEKGTILVQMKNKEYKECQNLPEPKDGVFYIVSGLIGSALRRADLLVPNTVRDENGQIIGCDSFAQIGGD